MKLLLPQRPSQDLCEDWYLLWERAGAARCVQYPECALMLIAEAQEPH